MEKRTLIVEGVMKKSIWRRMSKQIIGLRSTPSPLEGGQAILHSSHHLSRKLSIHPPKHRWPRMHPTSSLNFPSPTQLLRLISKAHRNETRSISKTTPTRTCLAPKFNKTKTSTSTSMRLSLTSLKMMHLDRQMTSALTLETLSLNRLQPGISQSKVSKVRCSRINRPKINRKRRL